MDYTQTALPAKNTLSALNVPIEDRIHQIELNLERWRWLPQDLGDRYIWVNTADFKLSVVEKEQKIMEMRVVVGKPARKTPVFSFNPLVFRHQSVLDGANDDRRTGHPAKSE